MLAGWKRSAVAGFSKRRKISCGAPVRFVAAMAQSPRPAPMLTVGAARIMEVYVDAIRQSQEPSHTIGINEPGPLAQFKRHPLQASAFPPCGNASYMQPSDNYQPAVYKVPGAVLVALLPLVRQRCAHLQPRREQAPSASACAPACGCVGSAQTI